MVKLYNATRAVGAVAAVVNVPPAAVPDVAPKIQVGATTYPKPALVTVKLVICPLLPIFGVAAGQQPAGNAKVAVVPAPGADMVNVGGTEYTAVVAVR